MPTIKGRCPNCRALMDVISPEGGEQYTCPACGVTSPVKEWERGYLDPLAAFGVDNLCTCGGELWYTISSEHPFGVLMCDRCGAVRKESGDGR